MSGTFVQKVNNVTNGTTVTISPTAGNLLIAGIKTTTGAGNPTASLTDNLSDSYSTAYATTSPSGSIYFYSIFYLKNIPAGITGLTAAFSGGTPGNTYWSVLEYSGLDPASPFIGVVSNVQASPGATADAITSTGLSLSAFPALLIGFSSDETGNSFNAGTGFTSRGAGSTGGGILWEDQRFVINTSPPATFTSATHGTDTFTTFGLGFAEPPSNFASIGWISA